MHILAVDTSTDVCSVAILKYKDVVIEKSNKVKAGHSGIILATIDELIRKAEILKTDLGLVAVGLGPGSFTGLRIGIATAKGLASALNCQIRGVSSLFAMAKNVLNPGIPVMPVLDAKKGEVFCALYSKEGYEQVPPVNIEPGTVRDIISEQTLFIGNALELYDDLFRRGLGKYYIPGEADLWHPRAAVIGLLAQDDDASMKDITPLYVRASDATLMLEKIKSTGHAF